MSLLPPNRAAPPTVRKEPGSSGQAEDPAHSPATDGPAPSLPAEEPSPSLPTSEPVPSLPADEPVAMLRPDAVAGNRLEEIGPGGLRRRAARGTLVNAAWMIGVNGLTVVKGVAVAGLLGASAYGLWGLLTISFGTLFALAAVGLDDKYIQQDHPDQRSAFEVAFTLQAMLCGLFTLIGLIGIPIFAAAYDQPDILVPGLVLALAMPLVALQTPVWVFYRRMDFVRQRVLQSFDPVISFVVTIGLAVAGVGLWSLVIGTLAGSLTAACVAVRSSPYRLRFRYERGALRAYSSYSWPLLFGSAAAVLIAQIPVIVASRSLGTAAVGAIVLAFSISQYTTRVDSIVTQALYPAICAVKERTDLLFESFSKSNRLALLWGFPCGIAVALFAADGVHFVLGESWELAIPLIQVLGLTAAFDQIGFNWTAFARARGETRPVAVATAAMLIVVLAAGVPLLLSHGLAGFAIAMAGGTLAAMTVRLAYLVRLFPALRIAKHVSRAIVPTVPAAAVILGERALVGGPATATRALGEAALFAILVVVGTLAAERSLLREALGYLSRSRAQVTPATG